MSPCYRSIHGVDFSVREYWRAWATEHGHEPHGSAKGPGFMGVQIDYIARHNVHENISNERKSKEQSTHPTGPSSVVGKNELNRKVISLNGAILVSIDEGNPKSGNQKGGANDDTMRR